MSMPASPARPRDASCDHAVWFMRVALGVVVLVEAVLLALHPRAQAAFARVGFPDWVRLALAWSEIGAALLFLAPPTVVPGGVALLAVFATAAGLHVAHGEWRVGALLVYSSAVVVVLTHYRARHRRALAVHP